MGLGFRVWGLGFGVWGLGFGVWGFRFGVQGLGFRVWGLGFGVWGFGIYCAAANPAASSVTRAFTCHPSYLRLIWLVLKAHRGGGWSRKRDHPFPATIRSLHVSKNRFPAVFEPNKGRNPRNVFLADPNPGIQFFTKNCGKVRGPNLGKHSTSPRESPCTYLTQSNN